MVAVHAASASDARKHLKDLIDAAGDGRVATVTRDSERVAIVDAERLRQALAALNVADAQVVFEEGEWAAFIPGLPLNAVASSLDDVVEELVVALRDYADDWNRDLRTAPNHAENWGIVQLIGLSTDEQLRGWVTTE